MDKLKRYLIDHQMTQAAMAKALSLSPSYLSEILAGHKRPSLVIALRIERATLGAVPPQAWEKT